MAGPALMEPPRINTTRMIANSSTTDSEMATTDHTLGRSALPARGCPARTPPPEPSCHQPGPRMRQVRHRRPHCARPLPGPYGGDHSPHPRRTPNSVLPHRNSTAHSHRELLGIVSMSTQLVRRQFELSSRAHQEGADSAFLSGIIRTKPPISSAGGDVYLRNPRVNEGFLRSLMQE
jgi:hypothetical protein